MKGKEKKDEFLYDQEKYENDNLYTLPEEGEDINFKEKNPGEEKDSFHEGEYVLEEDEDFDEDSDLNEEEDDDETSSHSDKGNVLGLLIKILTSPVEGWKELKRRKYTPDEVTSGCFFPMTALASLSEFADKFYTTISLGDCLMQALYTFISFFFGYFTIMLLGSIMLPTQSKSTLKEGIGKEFVMMNLSSLAIFYTANKLFPMIDAALFFLPIWTVYLIYKGVRILRIPINVESRTKIIFVFLIIGMPIFWEWILELIFKNI